ncbi:hypothetical protein SCOCK_240059 [Actinacidiphila cocklensis]|uniref:Uncharacterized protein n=1 Tax=Actinacidiphila cocklensis TaxID=887465 RepID=A0A9W4DUB6_9ACTN|nr:hypothetical protein SCOCK_240059 [Actinacidiphila cocklensis]
MRASSDTSGGSRNELNAVSRVRNTSANLGELSTIPRSTVTLVTGCEPLTWDFTPQALLRPQPRLRLRAVRVLCRRPVRRLVLRRQRRVQPLAGALQPAPAHLGQFLAALPQRERLLQRGAARLQPAHDVDQLVAGLLVTQRGGGGLLVCCHAASLGAPTDSPRHPPAAAAARLTLLRPARRRRPVR